MQKNTELLKVNNRTDTPIIWWVKQELNTTEKKDYKSSHVPAATSRINTIFLQ